MRLNKGMNKSIDLHVCVNDKKLSITNYNHNQHHLMLIISI